MIKCCKYVKKNHFHPNLMTLKSAMSYSVHLWPMIFLRHWHCPDMSLHAMPMAPPISHWQPFEGIEKNNHFLHQTCSFMWYYTENQCFFSDHTLELFWGTYYATVLLNMKIFTLNQMPRFITGVTESTLFKYVSIWLSFEKTFFILRMFLKSSWDYLFTEILL